MQMMSSPIVVGGMYIKAQQMPVMGYTVGIQPTIGVQPTVGIQPMTYGVQPGKA